jgi:two-component system, OmpR family, heavy metal sensor histidine kinase CusS
VIRRLSLTARLTCLYTLTSAVVLLGLGWLILVAVERHFLELDRATLQDKFQLIKEVASTSSSMADFQERLAVVLHSHKDLSASIQDTTGLLYATPGLKLPAEWLHSRPSGSAQDLFTWNNNGVSYRVTRGVIPPLDGSSQPLQVWVALNTQHHTHFIANFRQTLALYGVLATLFSGLLGWYAARSGLRPLHAMKSRAQAVTVHKLDQRMSVDAVPIEMADLAATLNDMLERLQFDFQRLTEFSSDLAHELRTPISNMLTETQVELSRPRTVEQYQETLASNSEELQRLARTVSDMLYLATTEHGLALPHPEQIRVQDEIHALFDFYDALADEANISMSTSGEGLIHGDRLMVRRALNNLLSNALRHTPVRGTILVEVDTAADATSVHVTNTGPAIDPDVLPRLFDRFYRADSARVHPESIGSGLGLPITRAIMRAHGGDAFATAQGSGIRFTLRFPARPASSQA